MKLQGPARLVGSLALLLSVVGAAGQGMFQALSFTPPGAAGYSTKGVGWSFVPTSDLLVTAIYSSAPQVTFWQGTSAVIATYEYTGPYGTVYGGPATNFQSILSLHLSAGQTYSISTQFPDFNSQFFAFGPEFTPFSTSPYISQFASYYVSSSGEWTSPTTPPSDNANCLLLGPNFRFDVIPEPGTFGLCALAALPAGWRAFRRRRCQCS